MMYVHLINYIYNIIKKRYRTEVIFYDKMFSSKENVCNIKTLGRVLVNIIKQLFWIFLFSLLGDAVSILISNFVAIPGSVIGMVLLFITLHFNWLKLSQVEEVGTWLTDNMAILFVPAGVGLMTNFDLLANVWLHLLIIMVVTVIIMMWFVGTIVQKIMKTSDPKANHTLVERTDNND